MTPIKDTDYLAVSARLHAMENRLLSPEKQERLLEAANEAEARKLLAECGYAENSPLEEALRLRRESLFKDLSSFWTCSGSNSITIISKRSSRRSAGGSLPRGCCFPAAGTMPNGCRTNGIRSTG